MKPFSSRLMPAPRNGGFSMEDYWIWCGSVIRGEDGKFQMFASRIPRGPDPARPMPMSPHWLFSSEIVRASSNTPEGPYRFEEVVLPRRGHGFFDGMNTHNPTIHRAPDGTYLLFYMGTTYDCEAPDPRRPETWLDGEANRDIRKRRAAKRIGLTYSSSVYGPCKRMDSPLMSPRPGKWDAIANTNPAPCILPDGKIKMFFKSRSVENGPLQIGLAEADNWRGPYRQVSDRAVFSFDDPSQHIEDPYLWHEDGRFFTVMKDMEGGICGEKHAGIIATSDDCANWNILGKAYSRKVLWNDGTTTVQGFIRKAAAADPGRQAHAYFLRDCRRAGWFLEREPHLEHVHSDFNPMNMIFINCRN